jgi:hypothetical protein
LVCLLAEPPAADDLTVACLPGKQVARVAGVLMTLR